MSNEFNRILISRQSAAIRKYHCEQCRHLLNIADKKDHLESDDHKKKRKKSYCETYENDMKIQPKSSHIKSTAPI